MHYEPTLSDDAFLNRLAVGEHKALEDLIAVYFPILCKFSEKFIPDQESAKDVVQETFIKLWSARESFSSPDALKAFLFVVTRNGCLNFLRGMQRREGKHRNAHREGGDAEEPHLARIVHLENIALIYEVVRTLSPEAQTVFYLSFEEGMTVKQISEYLAMNIHTVKSHKKKTLMLLRSRFGNRRNELLFLLAMLLK